MSRLTIIIICMFLLITINLCPAESQKGMKRPPNQQDMPDIVYRNGWALVIGVDKYPNLPSQFQLNYAGADADADAVADMLNKKFGFEKENITVLKNEQATKAKIIEKLNSYANTKTVDREDCVLIYFSGHGQTVALPRGAGEMGFLVPYDAKIDDLSSVPNLAEYRQYCIAMNELNEASKTIPAKHIIFIIDACYSGLVLNSTRGFFNTNIPRYLGKVASAEVQQMITAGGKGEQSEERPDVGHGVFTYKFLKGLDDELADTNNDGVITGTELSTYLTSAVQEMTNGKQNPRYGRASEGEFLFIPQKSAPKNTGKLVVQIYPSDAVITVKPSGGSEDTSFSVSAGETEVPIGTYSLTVEKESYETLSKDRIKVTTATPAKVNLILKQKPQPPKPPSMATVDGQYLTQDTQVSVNGSRVILPYKTAPGTYNIHLERGGYNPVDMIANLTVNQLFSPKPEWSPIPKPSVTGILQVQVNPTDAKLSVTSLEDAKNYDLTSNEIELPPGRYVATAKRDNYNSEVKDFKIASNQRALLNLTLRPKQSEKILKPEKAPTTLKPNKISKGVPRFYALGASMVVPGLGQHLQGRRMRGFINEGVILGAGLFALVANSRHNSTLDDYIAIRSELENEAEIQMGLTLEIKSLFKKQDDAYNKAKSAKNLAIVSQLLFFTAWGINAFDAGFLTSPTQNNSGLAIEVQPISNGAEFIVKSSF